MEPRMHVCLTGPKTCPPKIGGIEVFAYELGKRLALRGIRVSLIAHRETGQKKVENVKGIEVHRVFGFENRFSLKLSMIPGLLRMLGRLRPDVIHANDATSGCASTITSGKKTLVTIHGLGFSKEDWPTPFRQGIRLLQMRSMRGAGAVTTTDNVTAARLREYVPGISVLSGGVDTDSFRKGAWPRPAGLDSNKINVIFAGRLTKVKGIDLLLEALPLLNLDLKTKIRLVIIGSGAMSSFLGSNPKDLPEVRWIGEIPHDEMQQYFANADLLVLPSRSEGLPLSLLEAMSSELPVVCTRTGGIETTIDERYATIANSPTAQSIAEAMNEALQNPAIVRSKARAARELVEERFSWDKVAEAYLDIYNTLTP